MVKELTELQMLAANKISYQQVAELCVLYEREGRSLHINTGTHGDQDGNIIGPNHINKADP